MTKHASRLYFCTVIALAAVMSLCLLADPAHAARRAKPKQQPTAQKTPVVLVLPFQVNAGPDFNPADEDLTPALVNSLTGKGLQTVSVDRMYQALEAGKQKTLDLEAARKLAGTTGATHALYGSISQVGDTVSIDARLVPATGKAVPMFVEQRGGASAIVPAMSDLAARVNGEIIQAQAAPVSSEAPAGPSASLEPIKGGALAGVEVRGTKVLDPEVVLMRINTRRGDQLDSTAINAEVKRIWELGYFSDVRVDIERRPEGPVVVYTVTEKPRIETITVDGAKEIDEEDVLSVMSSKAGAILNEKMLAEDIQKILELYRKKGFYRAQINQEVIPRQSGAVAEIALKISEGKKLYIKKVTLEGVKQLSESDVKGEMLLSERSIISWITGTGVLKEELIERDSSAIASFYLNHGFMDITVGAPQIDYEENGIAITFPVNEGKRYRLNAIHYTGDLIDSEANLNNLIQCDDMAKKKEFFNLSIMQDDTRKLADYYSNFGFAFADVNPRPSKPEGEEALVDITFDIEKHNKVYVRRVLVEGNNKTRDNVILREMRVTDGEQFQGNKLRRSTERLNKLSYFEMAETELVPTSNEEEVDLKIKVKERPTGALMAGVGYSTFSKVGVSGTLMESNLWGKGYNVSFQAGFSGRRDAYTLSFTNPQWNDTKLSVGADVYHWRDDYIDYRKRTTGGVLRFAYPLGEYTSVGWGYRLDQYKLYDLDDDTSKLIRDYATGIRYSSVALGRITRDTTDRLHPTSGHIDRVGTEYGGGILGGDDDFISTSIEHQSYYELAKNHVLHGRIKGSAIFPNGSGEVPVFERFWMGGIDTVRGYNSRDIVPLDRETGDRIGGTRMAFTNLEYIWSVSNEMGINIVPFFDMGFNIDADHSYKWDDELKKSVGTELRWRSPMGDLRFAYGFPLDKNRNGDRNKTGRFEFSMGQFF